MKTLIIALLSVSLSVAAQFSLKAGMSSAEVRAVMAQSLGPATTAVAVLANRFVLGGFALYGLGAMVWLNVLSSWEVSKAYPLVGLGFCLTVLVGWLLGENVTPARATGVLLICLGVVLVGRS